MAKSDAPNWTALFEGPETVTAEVSSTQNFEVPVFTNPWKGPQPMTTRVSATADPAPSTWPQLFEPSPSRSTNDHNQKITNDLAKFLPATKGRLQSLQRLKNQMGLSAKELHSNITSLIGPPLAGKVTGMLLELEGVQLVL